MNYTEYASKDMPQNNGMNFFKRNPIIPNINISTSIELLSLFYRDREAVECKNLTLSYKQLIKYYHTISKAFKELGVKKGDIISICMDNYIQGVAAFFACNVLGATATFLNSFAPLSEIIEYVNEFESPILINFNKTPETNDEIKKKTKLRYIITLGKKDVNSIDINNDYRISKNENLINFNTLGSIAYYQKDIIKSIHSKKETALILFTSGTTGKPKSVVISNENILAAGIYLKNSSNIKNNKNDLKTLVCVPFTYPYGFATSTLMSLLSGRCAILAPDISKDTISEYLKKNPNMIFGSPALLELIMKNIPPNQDLSSVNTFISGGDYLTPEANLRGVQFFKEHGANVEIGNGSGNAETVSCGTNPVGIEQRPETAGKILTGTKAIIVDPDTLEEKKYGEIGLMCVSGKHVFKGYYNDFKLTEEAMFEKNGIKYFKTGTIGFIDNEGYFTITSRQSRFYINSSLNKVYCDKIQNIICKLSEVKDCAVVKVANNDALYVNKAYIVLNDIYKNDNDIISKIKAHCQNVIEDKFGNKYQLKDFEIPCYFEIVSELPRKVGTDKVDYSLLEEDAKKELNVGMKRVLGRGV
jgi:long-chain acyl-CoA synthetase